MTALPEVAGAGAVLLAGGADVDAAGAEEASPLAAEDGDHAAGCCEPPQAERQRSAAMGRSAIELLMTRR